MNRSITTINADVAQAEFGARGQGIVWAMIASGVELSHIHFGAHQNLILPDGLSHWDFSDPDTTVGKQLPIASDINGFGTSVAAVIAGKSSNDTGQSLRGMAPECKILSINVLSEETSERNVIEALRAIQAMNADGVGIRVHGVVVPLELSWDEANFGCGYSPVCVEVDRLVNSGVVVVVPAGNRGFGRNQKRSVEASIMDPGNAPSAITVGSTHRTLPREYGPSFFSARGPTADGRLKPDLLAPGEKITTCLAGELARASDRATGIRDGTAYAAAHVSGGSLGSFQCGPS